MSIAFLDAQQSATSATNVVTVGDNATKAIHAEDLIVFCVINNDTSGVATIGSVSNIPTDVPPASDATRRVRFFSKIVTTADLAVNGNNGTVTCIPSVHGTGGSRRLYAYVIRSTIGFDANRVVGVGQSVVVSGSASNTLTEVAATRPAAGFCGVNLNNNFICQASWDGGTARNADFPGGSSFVHMFGKPNVAGTETAYPANTSRTQEQVTISGQTAGVARAIQFVVYQEKEPMRPFFKMGVGTTMRYVPRTIVTQRFEGKVGNATSARVKSKSNTVPHVTVHPPAVKFGVGTSMQVHVRPPPDFISPGQLNTSAVLVAWPTTLTGTNAVRLVGGKTRSAALLRMKSKENFVLSSQVHAGRARMASSTAMRFNTIGGSVTPPDTVVFDLVLGFTI